ncbi:MAG: lamin tail domain-containing protein [Bacteroidetes bacterium]|nr:lamin tail domain-containing protein [Bacteroidota bacterium]MCL6098950.1 lamin tail domain-containing protein [Bacteroidota bacterium]
MKFFNRGFYTAIILGTFLFSNLLAQTGSVLTFSEIMFYPAETNGEFVEINNTSATESIDLTGFKFKYYTSSNNSIVTLTGGMILGPGKFAVILQGNYDYANGAYKNIIPSDAVILKISSNNFGSTGMANTTGRDINLINADGVTIDSYTYSANNSAGISDEKFLLTKDNSVGNWKNSLHVNGTPGAKNSVSPFDFDLKISFIGITLLEVKPGDSVNVSVSVKNLGAQSAAFYNVNMYNDANKDSAGQTGESFYNTDFTNLANNDSLIIQKKIYIPAAGIYQLVAKVTFAQDENQNNNADVFSFAASDNPSATKKVFINEIMYDPYTGESEWIEIVNASTDPVNLKNWSASDLVSPMKAIITTTDKFLNPGEFAVLTQDASRFPYYPPKNFFQTKFGALSATDGVVIYDSRNTVVDSLKYNSNWGGAKGFSLERISYSKSSTDSTNWATTLNPDGGTPGVANSVLNMTQYPFGSLIINEIMYDPATTNSEYLEFYNTSNDSIQLGGMQIKLGTSSKAKLSNSFLKIPPKEYFVLTADTSIFQNYTWLKTESKIRVASSSFSLLNDGEMLVLKDMSGNTLDSLTYFPSWHNTNIVVTKNKSLERLNPALSSNDKSNWSTSVSNYGGTPGKMNSIFTENLSRESSVTINPNPFSPDNDGFEDFTIINLDLNQALSQVRIKVYDNQGRVVRTLENSRPSASKNSIVFDGMDDIGKPLRIGIYILLIETVSANGGATETLKAPVVIARKL